MHAASQEGHPIAYEIWRFHEQKSNLGIYEKDLLVVIQAVAWKHYVLEAPYVVHCDHQCYKYSDKAFR